VNSTVPMMVPSNPVSIEEGDADGIDAANPDLQAYHVDAFGSYVPPPWTPSYRCGGAGETLVWGCG
jgi:hypothetical protein